VVGRGLGRRLLLALLLANPVALLANPVALLAVLLWVIEGSLASLAVDEDPAVGRVVPLNDPWRGDLGSALAWALVAVRGGLRGVLLLAVAVLLVALSVHLSAREAGTEGGGGGARFGEEQCGMKLVACCGGKMWMEKQRQFHWQRCGLGRSSSVGNGLLTWPDYDLEHADGRQ